MTVTKTPFKDLLLLQPKLHSDPRGSFSETFRSEVLEESLERPIVFVQDNETHSTYGVIRGLHYQIAPFAQSKLVRVVQGEVLDVVVDLRKNEKTFGKVFTQLISGENKTQLFVPRGFAHGYITLSEFSVFQYKVDNYYNKTSERSLQFNDPNLAIDWQLPASDWVFSEKDGQNPSLKEAVVFDSDSLRYE